MIKALSEAFLSVESAEEISLLGLSMLGFMPRIFTLPNVSISLVNNLGFTKKALARFPCNLHFR